MENFIDILRRRLQPPDDNKIDNSGDKQLFCKLKEGRFKEFVFRPEEADLIDRKEESLSNIIYFYGDGKARNFIISIDEKINKNNNFKKEVCDGPNFLSYMLQSSNYIDRILYNYLLEFYVIQKQKVAISDIKIVTESSRPWIHFSYSI